MKDHQFDFAFPKDVPEGDQPQKGLTKREYFAAMALMGISANPDYSTGEYSASDKALIAVSNASALIEQLNKT